MSHVCLLCYCYLSCHTCVIVKCYVTHARVRFTSTLLSTVSIVKLTGYCFVASFCIISSIYIMRVLIYSAAVPGPPVFSAISDMACQLAGVDCFQTSYCISHASSYQRFVYVGVEASLLTLSSISFLLHSILTLIRRRRQQRPASISCCCCCNNE